MKINKLIIIWGLILNGIGVFICFLFNYYFTLEKPVFLEHYYEYGIPLYEETNPENEVTKVGFALHYIANINDNSDVVGISFKEKPNIRFYAWEDYFEDTNFNFHPNNFNLNAMYNKNINRYSLHTVYVTMDTNDRKNMEDNFYLSQATIQFNNGETLETNIGKIVFYKDNKSAELLEDQQTYSSNDGTSGGVYQVNDNITLTQLHSDIIETFKEKVEIKFNDKPYSDVSGMRYQEGDQLKISTKLHNLLENPFTIIDINPTLSYKDNNNNSYTVNLYNISSPWRDLNVVDFFKYLHKKGGF